MKKIKIILGLAAFYVLFSAFWQVGACELADIELKDDMKQMATQLGMRAGVSDIGSDADLRDTILRKAAQYGITLSPDQVTVLRDGYIARSTAAEQWFKRSSQAPRHSLSRQCRWAKNYLSSSFPNGFFTTFSGWAYYT